MKRTTYMSARLAISSRSSRVGWLALWYACSSKMSCSCEKRLRVRLTSGGLEGAVRESTSVSTLVSETEEKEDVEDKEPAREIEGWDMGG